MKIKLHNYLALLVALIFCWQMSNSSIKQSLTADEPIFIASGLYHYYYSDFQMHQESPPLITQIIAFPLLFMDLKFPDLKNPQIIKPQQEEFHHEFLTTNMNQLSAIMAASRLPIIFSGFLLIILLYTWGKSLFGSAAALFAIIQAAISPNLLAHGQLATSDFVCALTFLFSLYAFWNATNSNKKIWWLITGLATGIAVMIKFTNLALGLCYIIIALILLINKRVKFCDLIIGGSLALVCTYLVISTCYKFDWSLSYLFHGISKIYHNHLPGYQYYLLGELYSKSRWDYCLILFALKAPLLLIISIPFLLLITRKHLHAETIILFIILPILIILIIAANDQTNIGIRRILMIFPLLYLGVAGIFHYYSSQLARTIIIIVALISGLDAIRVFPNHLTYFNFISGGPKAGAFLADDSNLDWGQGYFQLAEWQKQSPKRNNLTLMPAYFISPSIYKINYKIPTTPFPSLNPEGFYAINAQQLIRLRRLRALNGPGFSPDWLTEFKPIEIVGNSIYIYKFPESKIN